MQAILNQPAYTGKTHYNRTRTGQDEDGQPKKSGRGIKHSPTRPREEWIPMNVPPLISEDLW